MNNLYNIPGLIFKNGKTLLHNNTIHSLGFNTYRTHQTLKIRFECPVDAQDIKNLIVDYKMKKVFEFSCTGETRYELRRNDGTDFVVALELDVPEKKMAELLNLTDCFSPDAINKAYLNTFFEVV